MDFDDNLTVFGDFVRGTCELMCPVSERKLRERERLLHPLERLMDTNSSTDQQKNKIGTQTSLRKQGRYAADPSKIVKSFSRSAAGHKMPSPAELRPFPVLAKTVSYLIKEIACNETENAGWVDKYNFVTDRLRSVRQDMVIQNLSPHECIKLLEPMVIFHVFSGYWLCESSINLFDPKMNFSFLHECIKRLLVMYNVTKDTESSRRSDCHDQSHDFCRTTEHTMEALYLIINLGNPQVLNQSASKLLINSNYCKSCVKLSAFELSLSAWRGNYVKVCKSVRKLSPLLCMAAALHLPALRRHALIVMSTAYSSKSLNLPLETLQEILLWDDKSKAIEECKYYGVPVHETENLVWNVGFLRGTFKLDLKQVQPSRLYWLDKDLFNSSAINKILTNEFAF